MACSSKDSRQPNSCCEQGVKNVALFTIEDSLFTTGIENENQNRRFRYLYATTQFFNLCTRMDNG